MRILSLQPTATEMLFALGLGKHVVGVSHECTYPPAARRLPVAVRATIDSDTLSSGEIDAAVRASAAGGERLYQLDRDLVRKLKPDLVFTQDLCTVCAAAPIDLGGVKANVIPLHAHDLEGMFADLRVVAKATGADSSTLEKKLRARISAIVRRVPKSPRPKVFCIEWMDPIFATGHWVPELVGMAGGREVLGRKGEASRAVSWSEVAVAAPQKLLFMCCGFTPERTLRDIALVTRRRGWPRLPAVKAGEVYVADGPNYFNGAGPRLVDALEILAEVIHPPLFCGAEPHAGVRRLTPDEIEAARIESPDVARPGLFRKGTVYDEDVHPRYS